MTNYTLDWSIMNVIGFISKENPVYLYKIVRSSNKKAPLISFKEFIVVKAWSSEGNDVLIDGHRYFDYHYNGRIHHKQEVGLSEFFPFIDDRGFNIWSYMRDDNYARQECKKWLDGIINKSKQDIKQRATKLINDQNFISHLHVVEKDGAHE